MSLDCTSLWRARPQRMLCKIWQACTESLADQARAEEIGILNTCLVAL